MNGFVLRYTTKDKVQLVLLNNKLFGRITVIRRMGRSLKYFYKGLLHDSKYAKLANGCYFILERIPDDPLYKLNEATIESIENEIKTGREHWEGIIKERGIRVRNI